MSVPICRRTTAQNSRLDRRRIHRTNLDGGRTHRRVLGTQETIYRLQDCEQQVAHQSVLLPQELAPRIISEENEQEELDDKYNVDSPSYDGGWATEDDVIDFVNRHYDQSFKTIEECINYQKEVNETDDFLYIDQMELTD